jgi:hypothetical protein
MGVMAIGFVILEKAEAVAHQISPSSKSCGCSPSCCSSCWWGPRWNVGVAWRPAWPALGVIAVGLVCPQPRHLGVPVGCRVHPGERWFCVVAYLPKATVQAAIGATPLAAGVAGGEVILAVAVLSIVVTAPWAPWDQAGGRARAGPTAPRPEYSFKDLRQRLGLPRVGARSCGAKGPGGGLEGDRGGGNLAGGVRRTVPALDTAAPVAGGSGSSPWAGPHPLAVLWPR